MRHRERRNGAGVHVPVPIGRSCGRWLRLAASIVLGLAGDRALLHAAERPGFAQRTADPDSIRTRSPLDAWREAVILMETRKFVPSLLLFQQALMDARIDANAWELHFDYASCLNSASFEVIDRLGVDGPRQSVSAGRIALLRAAAAQLDTAEQIAKEPRVRAMIRSRRAQLLEVWGFPLDAYGWYRASLAADSTCFEALIGLVRTAELLRDPSGTISGGGGH